MKPFSGSMKASLQAKHPDCPPALWRELAKDHYESARKNAALPLFALEDPMLYSWDAIEMEYAEYWLGNHAPLLNKRRLALWSADLTERILPIFEKFYPKDSRPRQAMDACRDFAQDKITEEQLQKIREAARDAVSIILMDQKITEQNFTFFSGAAIRMVCRVASEAKMKTAAGWAAKAVAFSQTENESLFPALMRLEYVWQWRRLLFYQSYNLKQPQRGA